MEREFVEHYERIAEFLEHLAESHSKLAELFALCPDSDHTEGDRALADAEKKSAETCRRAAASIRSRFVEAPKPRPLSR